MFIVNAVARLMPTMFTRLFRPFPTKMVIIVRTDLKLGPGKTAAQCAHAAVSLYVSALQSSDPCLKSWLCSGQPKIVLKVDSEQALRDIYANAKQQGLHACLVYDAGKTQITAGTLTVMGLGPGKADKIDLLTKSLKLL